MKLRLRHSKRWHRKMRNDQKVPSDRCQRVSSTTWTSSATRTPEIQKSVALSPHRSHLWLSSLLARLLFGIALLSSLNCQRSKTVKLKKLYGRKLPINMHFRNDSTVIHDLIWLNYHPRGIIEHIVRDDRSSIEFDFRIAFSAGPNRTNINHRSENERWAWSVSRPRLKIGRPNEFLQSQGEIFRSWVDNVQTYCFQSWYVDAHIWRKLTRIIHPEPNVHPANKCFACAGAPSCWTGPTLNSPDLLCTMDAQSVTKSSPPREKNPTQNIIISRWADYMTIEHKPHHPHR